MAHYLALRELKVGEEVRHRGDEVPEAKDWPDLSPWLSNGYIEAVDDSAALHRRKAELMAADADAERRKQEALADQQEAEGEPEPSKPRIDRMPRDELLDFAREHELPVTTSMTKAELIDLLEAHGYGAREE